MENQPALWYPTPSNPEKTTGSGKQAFTTGIFKRPVLQRVWLSYTIANPGINQRLHHGHLPWLYESILNLQLSCIFGCNLHKAHSVFILKFGGQGGDKIETILVSKMLVNSQGYGSTI
jgi:hypothetical protein